MAITTHGASMIFPGEGFDAGQTLRAVEQEQCTALYGVPTMFIAELAQPDFASFDLRSLKKGIMAGSPCPQEVMQKVLCSTPRVAFCRDGLLVRCTGLLCIVNAPCT